MLHISKSLTRPMSSPRTPPCPSLNRSYKNCIPSLWYSRRKTFIGAGTCILLVASRIKGEKVLSGSRGKAGRHSIDYNDSFQKALLSPLMYLRKHQNHRRRLSIRYQSLIQDFASPSVRINLTSFVILPPCPSLWLASEYVVEQAEMHLPLSQTQSKNHLALRRKRTNVSPTIRVF